MTNSPSQTDIDPTAGYSSRSESDPLTEATQKAGQSASDLAERATDIGLKQADRGKDQAAESVSMIGDSIRRVSTDMQDQRPAIANAAATLADQTDRLADYLQRTDAREIIGTLEDLARRQPLIFLGGAFVLGVAVSRFLKAGTPASSPDHFRESERRYGTYPVRSEVARPRQTSEGSF